MNITQELDTITYNGVPLIETAGRYYFCDESLRDEPRIDMQKRARWMAVRDLKASSRPASINHLLHGVQGNMKHGRVFVRANYWDEMTGDERACMDHVSLFFRPGAARGAQRLYFITSQPYNLDLESYQALERFCAVRGLECSINYADAWHCPGWAPLIIIARKGNLAKLTPAMAHEWPVADFGPGVSAAAACYRNFDTSMGEAKLFHVTQDGSKLDFHYALLIDNATYYEFDIRSVEYTLGTPLNFFTDDWQRTGTTREGLTKRYHRIYDAMWRLDHNGGLAAYFSSSLMCHQADWMASMKQRND